MTHGSTLLNYSNDNGFLVGSVLAILATSGGTCFTLHSISSLAPIWIGLWERRVQKIIAFPPPCMNKFQSSFRALHSTESALWRGSFCWLLGSCAILGFLSHSGTTRSLCDFWYNRSQHLVEMPERLHWSVRPGSKTVHFIWNTGLLLLN